MSLTIDLTQDQIENEDIKSSPNINQFLTNLEQRLRNLDKKHVFNTQPHLRQDKGSLTMQFQITFILPLGNSLTHVKLQTLPRLQLQVKTYISLNNFAAQKVPQCIEQLKSFSNHYFTYSFQFIQNQFIHIRPKLNSQINNLTFYSKAIISTCQMSFQIVQYIQNYINHYKKLLIHKQKPHECMVSLRKLAVIEQQRIELKNIYRNQRKGMSFLEDPEKVEPKHGQICCQIKLYQNQHTITKPLEQIIMDKQFLGAYSSITYIKTSATVINTNHSSMLSQYSHNYQIRKKQVNLIHKYCLKNNDSSQKSLQNQISLLQFLGGKKVPYICNYYKIIPNQIKGIFSQKKYTDYLSLFADYHEKSAIMFLNEHISSKPTMLDIINFALQVTKGLKQFYIDNGLIHRDIKALNIMIDFALGLIQIIDHGSVMYFNENQQKETHAFRNFKKKIDTKLRSTQYFRGQNFALNLALIDKYKSYKLYKSKNSIHKTFDVYSLGILLKIILKIYDKKTTVKSLQATGKWQNLLNKMTQPDFQKRITIQKVQKQLKKLKQQWFSS